MELAPLARIERQQLDMSDIAELVIVELEPAAGRDAVSSAPISN